MEPSKKTARTAGLFYLVLIVSGIFSLLYVPAQLIDMGNPEWTLMRIEESETLFRLGIVAGLLCFTCFVGLPLTLYQLLAAVQRDYAISMVVLALVSVPISYMGIAYQIDVLSLMEDPSYVGMDNGNVLKMEVILRLMSFSNTNLVAHIFWGLWLFPFGYLVYRSGFLPKFLGVMLMLGCFGYLMDFLGYFLLDGYGETFFADLVGIPAAIGEIGICLWLLLVGVRTSGTLGRTAPDRKN